MSLMMRSRRSQGTIVLAWLGLTNMVFGQMGIAFAGPSSTTAVPAVPGPPQMAAHLDGPIERLKPASFRNLDSDSSPSQIATLFDERAGVGLISERMARFKLLFSGAAEVQRIGVYGEADGALAIIPEDGKPEEQVIDLRKNGKHWNRFDVSKPVTGNSLTIEWRPARSGALLREIELWGRTSERSAERQPARLPEALFTGLPAGATEFPGTGSNLPISVASVFQGGEGGSYHVRLSQEPGRFERMFLVYELASLEHFTAAPRTINGKSLASRPDATLGGKGGLQVEEISSRWLQLGDNVIQFLPADESDPAGYQVSRLRLVGILPVRNALAASVTDAWWGLLDGSDNSAWNASFSKKSELREWAFSTTSQPEAIDFRLPTAGAGTLNIWAGKRGSAKFEVDLAGFEPGWHRVPLANLPASSKLLLSLVAGKEQGIAISELAISASPLPVDDAPRMTITYPLSGECVNHRVYVRGFIEPTGPAALFVNGVRKTDGLSEDGVLSFAVSDREAGAHGSNAFRLKVEARYSNGTNLAREIPFEGCVEQPALVRGDDGYMRQPVEDVGAPYAAVVRAKTTSTLNFADASVEIPAGAVERDMRVSIRPLAAEKVAPMDSGMANVTPGKQAYRFGPHGMAFRKPVKLALPFDKNLIPTGYTQEDIRTFYYDEHLKKWQEVGLLAHGKGALLAVSEHFTDFINATVARPESPGPQAQNPTSMKDIKVANPAAGISLIEPPVANSRGTANVHMPIEVPPGRNGLQPQLAIGYDSDAGNGWLGVGWNVQTPSIEIDTRFGVPKYDGKETYLLDGAAITKRPVEDLPTGAPTEGEHYIRRVEGPFDYIMKVGTSSDYYWVVVDKNGTRRTYGNSENARLSPPKDRTHTFKWFLEKVEDRYGNYISYEYRKAVGQTPDGDSNGLPWVQVYPSRIAYTGGSSLTPPYAVIFHSSESDHWGPAGRRQDILSTARSGFDVRTRELLDEIEVRLEAAAPSATTIRRYHLVYERGDFAKTVLRSIGVYGPNAPQKEHPEIGRFYQHDFEYFESSKGFSAATVWSSLSNTSFSKNGLSGGEAVEAGFDAFIGVGPVGCELYGGGGGGYTTAADVSNAALIDINGDGLPDLVDKDGRILLNGFADSTRTRGRLSSTQVTVPSDLTCGSLPLVGSSGLPFSNTSQSILSASVGARAFGGMVGGGYSWSWSWGQQNAGLTDFDGDGLPDFATTCDGFKVFSTKYDAAGKLQIAQKQFDTTIEQPAVADVEPLTDEQKRALHPLNSLASWTAPYDGTVEISGPVVREPGALAIGSGQANSGRSDNDGINVAIEHASSPTLTKKVWARTVFVDDRPCTPSGQSDCNGDPACTPSGCDGAPITIGVKAGDRLYFHVDGRADEKDKTTAWTPGIKYQGKSEEELKQVDSYGFPKYIYSRNDDFRVIDAAMPGYPVNTDGKVKVDLQIKRYRAGQPLKLQVLQNGKLLSSGVFQVPGDLVGATQFSIPAFAVRQRDVIVVTANYSDGKVDPDDVDVSTTVTFTSICGMDPDRSMSTCRDVGDCDATYCKLNALTSDPPGADLPRVLKVFVQGFPMTRDVGLRVMGAWPYQSQRIYETRLYYLEGMLDYKPKPQGPVEYYLLSKKAGTIWHHSLSDANQSSGGDPWPAQLQKDLEAGDELAALIYVANPDDLKLFNTLSWIPRVGNFPIPLTVEGPPTDSRRMVGGFRGWQYGEWNSDREAPFGQEETFQESVLLRARPTEESAEPLSQVTPWKPRPGQDKLVRDTPEGKQVIPVAGWLGMGPDSVILATHMKPSRIGGISPERAAAMSGPGTLRKTYSTLEADDGQLGAVTAAEGSGKTETRQEFIDLNGDRRPDSVRSSGAQFFDESSGKYVAGPMSLNLNGALRKVDIETSKLGLSLGSAAGATIASVNGSGETKSVKTVVASLGRTEGSSNTNTDFVDLNGDGLPDHVVVDDDGSWKVQINLGYTFGPVIRWPSISEDVRTQVNSTNSLQMGFAGLGGGAAYSVTRSDLDMVDLNGDGLPDRVYRRMSGGAFDKIVVNLNRGTDFGPNENWDLPTSWGTTLEKSVTTLLSNLQSNNGLAFGETTSYNAGIGFYYPINIIFVCVAIQASVQAGQSDSGQEMEFEDMDGDGMVDQVLKVKNGPFRSDDPNLRVKLNKAGRSNLLKTVKRPLGGAFELSYERYGNHVDMTANPKVDMPHSQWALWRVRVTDGRGNVYSNFITYPAGAVNTMNAAEKLGSGFYDRTERENYGYYHVVTTRGFDSIDGGWVEGDGSVLEQFYFNQDYYSKGLLRAEFEIRPDGKVMNGTRFSYQPYPPQPERTGWAAPLEASRTTLFLEGKSTNVWDTASMSHNVSRDYDDEGNVTDIWDDGNNFDDTDTAAHKGKDNVHYIIGYYKESDTHITRANSIVAKDSSENVIRNRGATFWPGKGTIDALANYISGGKDPASKSVRNNTPSTYSYTYDDYGNVKTATDPSKYVLTYTYDSVAQTFRTDVVDSFGYHSKATPDYRFGTNSDTTDINGQKEVYTYDDFGRLLKVFGPNEQGTATPTIGMTYSPDATPPSAVTQHLDVQHSGDTIDTVTFIDGLGRVIQTKKDVDYDGDGTGTVKTGMSVSGLVKFDFRGRVASQGQPVFDTGPANSFVTVASKNPTTFSYDTLGRPTEVVGPDGAKTTMEYGLMTMANGIGVGTTVKDPIANASDGKTTGLGERTTVRDVNGRPIDVVEYNNYLDLTSPSKLTTTYEYNPMGELVKVGDAKLNVTTATYDTVGQMVSLTSPDAGKTEYLFDLAGNLGAKQTSVLAGQSKYVTYEYDWNRLKKINYPNMPAVTYEYGSSAESGDGKGNIAGRTKKVTMEGGSETRTYDKMGNVVQTVTTLKHLQTSLPGQTFTMKFSYDSFGRMQTMTFPNWVKQDYTNLDGPGELVTYKYDHGGNLDSIKGYMQTPVPHREQDFRDFAYLNRTTYDEFEQRRVIESGNGIVNKYGYYEDTRRLKTVYAAALGPQEVQLGKPETPFHNMTYTYDLVGNIKKVENATTAFMWQNDGVHTGPRRMEYTYDNLYQLRSATGKYRQKFDHGYTYASTFQYDQIGNLTKKSQLETRIVWENVSSVPEGLAGLEGERPRPDGPVERLSYTMDYKYTGTRPHAANTITETSSNGSKGDHVYSYDGNGNNAGNTYQNTTRVLTWDEENRLKQVTQSGTSLGKFLYSADGERTQKQTAAGDSLYVNQFYAYQPNRVTTKHVFAGETRIASKNETYDNCPTIFYYHPDHLGSTSFVSLGITSNSHSNDQMLVQHEDYFPFGERELGGNQEETDLSRANGLRREWTFNSKEFDVDTGLYYYGARYYDPSTSVWQSPDPILAGYMRGQTSGGVYNPRNLNLFGYSWNNPIVVKDPDGRAPIVAYLPGNNEDESARFKATADRLAKQLDAAGAKTGGAVPFSGVGERAGSIHRHRGKVSSVTVVGHGAEGSIASGESVGIHGDVVADTTLAEVAGAGQVESGGVVVGIACFSANLRAKDTVDTISQLESKQIGIAGFDDLVEFEGQVNGKYTGKVKTYEAKGSPGVPGGLVPTVTSPPVKGGRPVLKTLVDAERRVRRK